MRGFSGVESPLAGVAATADGDVLSKVPAGIFGFIIKNNVAVQTNSLSITERRATTIKVSPVR